MEKSRTYHKEELHMDEVQNIGEVAAATGLSRNQKVGIIVGATVLTAGAAYGVYRLVKWLKARKASKAPKTDEPHE